MANIGHLPLDTKIYLSNKELVNIKDVKIGDAVLSLKLPNIENKTRFDFLNYLLNKDLFDIENSFEMSETYVTNVGSVKKHIDFLLFNDCLIYKNQPVLVHRNDFLKVMTANQIADLIKEDKHISKTQINIQEENSNFFIKQKIENTIKEESSQISFYLNVLDNHLYFTENFIIFGGNI